MKIIVMPEELHEYLMFCFDKQVQSGITAEDLHIAAETFRCLKEAKTVDFSNLGKADLEKIGHSGIGLSIDPSQSSIDGEKDATR